MEDFGLSLKGGLLNSGSLVFSPKFVELDSGLLGGVAAVGWKAGLL